MSSLTLNTTNGAITLTPEDASGTKNILIRREGYDIGKFYTEYTLNTYSVGTSFSDLMTWTNITGLKAGSFVEIYCYIPVRNDSTSWGGFFFEPNVSFNNGSTWYGLGNSGYNAVMEYGQSIHYYDNTYVIDPGFTSDWSIRLKWRGASYDGTTTIRSSNSVNETRSGYNSNYLTTNNANMQHYPHYILKEYIPK